jgi:hypothetical protein
MKPSQVVASMILVGWLALYWIISLNGGFMTGFGPSGSGDPHNAAVTNWNQVRMDVALSLICLIPILALWTPSRILLGLGAVLLIPTALVGLFLLTIPPLGLAILATVIAWFYAARSRWNTLSLTESAN